MQKSNNRVLFISTARYSYPLDLTTEKKFAALSRVASAITIGFANGIRPQVFEQRGSFYLLPNLPVRTLRYALVFLVAPVIGLFLAVRHRVSSVVAQGPYEGLSAVFITRAARLFGRRPRLIIESHGDFEESLFLYRKVFAAPLLRPVMKAAAAFALRRADGLRSISATTGAQLARYAPHLRIEQFPTWTDIDAFHGARRRADAPTSGLVIYAGVLSPLKGVHNLIAAFAAIAAKHRHARLIVVGNPIDAAYEARLRADIVRLDITDRVEFAGHLSQQELAELLEQASVFTLPSYSEGLGRVLIEAMAVGVPVIATAVGGPAEFVRHGETGYVVPPGDEVALAAALNHVLADVSDATRVGASARLWARSFFSTDKYIEGYRALLESSDPLKTVE